MEAKLYVILGSHACRTGMLMLEHKGIEYKRVDLPTGLHPFALRLRGFAGNPAAFRRVDERPHHMLGIADRMGTVPALLVDGQRSRPTARSLAFSTSCVQIRRSSPPTQTVGVRSRRLSGGATRSFK